MIKKIEVSSIEKTDSQVIITTIQNLPDGFELYAQKRAWKVDYLVENTEILAPNVVAINYGQNMSQFLGRGIFDLFAMDEAESRYNFVDVNYLSKTPVERYHDMGESGNNPFDYQLYSRTDGRLAIIVDPKVQTDTNRLAIKYDATIEKIFERGNKIVVVTQFKLQEWSFNYDNLSFEPAMFVLRAPDQSVIKAVTERIDETHWQSTYDKASFGEFGQWAFGMIVRRQDNREFYLQIRGTTREEYQLQQDIGAKTWYKSSLPGIILDKQFMSNRAFILRARPRTQLESPKVRMNLKIAKLITAMKRNDSERVPKRLVFEREAWFAQDNAFSLFTAAINESRGDDLLYVINPDSPAFERAKEIGGDKVIAQYSVRYFLELMAAKELVTSIFPLELLSLYKTSGALVDKIRHTPVYYLGHGVLALKRMGVDYRRSSKLFDRVVVGSTFDYEAHKHLGFKSQNLRKIGYPRWDTFKNLPANKERKILFFPTWRGWVDKLNDSEFIISEYFQKIQELMQSKQLQEFLESENAVFEVFLHPNMRRFTPLLMDGTSNDNIRVLNPDEVSIAQLENESDLIISDYSSVVWDFAVQKKPVIFYQFDRKQYQTMVNGYFDLTELPVGSVTEDVEGVLNALQHYFDAGISMTESEAEWVEANFYGLSGSATAILDDLLSVETPEKITTRDDSYEAYEAAWKK